MKNSKWRKAMAIGLTVASLGATTACDGGADKVVKGLPDYSADETEKVFMIGGYVAPHKGVFNGGTADYITEEKYLEMREAGLDYILTLYEQGPTNPDIIRHLEHAQTAGVKVLVRWDAIINMGNATEEQMRSALGNLSDYESFWGIFAKDEPDASLFKPLGKACEVFKKVMPDKYFYVNLFPNYANNTMLGTNTYREYVNNYCALVNNGMIIEDHYPYGHTEGSSKYSVNSTYLANLEIIQKYAQYYNKEHWEYIQGESTGMGSKTPDYYDFRHQMYTSMCYGVINMQYFCYFSPFDNTEEKYAAFIGSDGQKTKRWYDGQKINAEIHKFDHVYLNYANNYTGVMTLIGTENETGKQKAYEALSENITSHERIKSATAQQDTIIGTYKDGDGRDGFMIVNYSVPAYRLKDKVTVEFNDADAVIYYREGEYNLADLEKGKFEIELDAGEGVFAIPVKY